MLVVACHVQTRSSSEGILINNAVADVGTLSKTIRFRMNLFMLPQTHRWRLVLYHFLK